MLAIRIIRTSPCLTALSQLGRLDGFDRCHRDSPIFPCLYSSASTRGCWSRQSLSPAYAGAAKRLLLDLLPPALHRPAPRSAAYPVSQSRTSRLNFLVRMPTQVPNRRASALGEPVRDAPLRCSAGMAANPRGRGAPGRLAGDRRGTGGNGLQRPGFMGTTR